MIEPTVQTVPFRDRSSWLKVFGVAQVLLGGLALLMIPLAILGMTISGQAMPLSTYVSAMAPIAVIGAALICIGIGTFQARRWARTLTMAGSATWLALGALSSVQTLLMMPATLRMMQNSSHGLPPGGALIAAVIAVGSHMVLGIGIPVLFLAFFRSGDVRSTFEQRDPSQPWTESLPLPRLILILVLLVGVASTAGLLLRPGPIPMFGFWLAPMAGKVVLATMLLLSAVLICGIWRGFVWAWWLQLALGVSALVSTLLTLARVDLSELNRVSGLNPEQIRSLSGSDVVFAQTTGSIVSFLMLVTFLVFIRRSFGEAPPPREASRFVTQDCETP